MTRYKSGDLTLGVEWQEIAPGFDIKQTALYSSDGDYAVQFYVRGGYGDIVNGFAGVPIDTPLRCNRMRVKAITGTVVVAFYLAGD